MESKIFYSSNGVGVEIRQITKLKYGARFLGSNLWFYDFKGVFKALLFCSKKLRIQMKRLDWTSR